MATAALALTLAFLASSEACAQDARALFEQGRAAYAAGDYSTAASRWEAAYRADPRAALQYNLAQAYERLGELAQAETAYEQFVENAPGDHPNLTQARVRLAAVRERLEHTGLMLSGGPEGATILVDGQDRGRLPRPDVLPLSPGQHELLIRAAGRADFRMALSIEAGRALEVQVRMQAGVPGSSGGGVSLVGVSVLAVGAAVLVGGVVVGAIALDAANSADSATGAAADEARTLGIAADVLLPVGAAAAITGLILMFVLPAEGSDQSSAQLRLEPSIGPDFAGAVVRGAI